jgi:hypothetical protein
MPESNRSCPVLECNEATRLISLSREQGIGVWKRLQLNIHLFICGPCAGFDRFVNETPKIIEQSEQTRPIPPELKERLRENLNERHSDDPL